MQPFIDDKKNRYWPIMMPTFLICLISSFISVRACSHATIGGLLGPEISEDKAILWWCPRRNLSSSTIPKLTVQKVALVDCFGLTPSVFRMRLNVNLSLLFWNFGNWDNWDLSVGKLFSSRKASMLFFKIILIWAMSEVVLIIIGRVDFPAFGILKEL